MQRRIFCTGSIRALTFLAIASAICFLLRSLFLDALVVVFGACLLCFLLSPLAIKLEKKLGRGPAAALSLLLAVGLLAAALILLVPMLARQLSDLVHLLPAMLDRLISAAERLLQRLTSLLPGVDPGSLPAPGDLISGLNLSGFGGVAKNAVSAISGLAGGIYRLSLMVILSCFFLIERENLLLRLELALPMRWRRDGVRLGKTLLRELRLYLRGQAAISLAVALLAALGLTLLGVEGGALLGLFVGLCNIIPYFGPLIGGFPAVLVALGSGWQRAAFTVGLLFLVQQVDGMLLSPRIMGNITGFSPATVLLALYLASNAGGVVGLLLAMPVMMAARTLYRVLVQSRLPERTSPVQGAE